MLNIKPIMKKDSKAINSRITDEQYYFIKGLAEYHNSTKSVVLRTLLDEMIEKYGKEFEQK